MRKDRMKTKEYSTGSTVLTVAFVLICLVWIMPIYEVVVNSLKSNNAINLDVFALPNSESFVGFAKFFYYLCLFSMIVPFQMVMFTLTSTADSLKLNTPWTIPVIYLGFGAGLAIFMFVGFVKSLPLEIEEAASIDGCGPVRTYFNVVLPMLKPTLISVGILELMWVWNDYLLPYLVLDITKYRTIPIHVQYLKGSYGTVDLGATMAVIMMAILPIIIVYLFCQKYIIKGVAAGAVKG